MKINKILFSKIVLKRSLELNSIIDALIETLEKLEIDIIDVNKYIDDNLYYKLKNEAEQKNLIKKDKINYRSLL